MENSTISKIEKTIVLPSFILRPRGNDRFEHDVLYEIGDSGYYFGIHRQWKPYTVEILEHLVRQYSDLIDIYNSPRDAQYESSYRKNIELRIIEFKLHCIQEAIIEIGKELNICVTIDSSSQTNEKKSNTYALDSIPPPPLPF